MSNIVGKQSLARGIAETVGVSQAKAEEMIDAMEIQIKQALAAGFTVRLPGICTAAVVPTPARTARNPRTGATVQIPARERVRFRASKALI